MILDKFYIIYLRNILNPADGVDTIIIGGDNMETKDALQAAHDAGTPISFIAKGIGKDPSTISKWLRGTSKYLATETEDDLRKKLHEIKCLWEKIDI